ncbi:type II secretion system protein GspM [Parazoarcus communis]|uniref:General secretion pathway protein GspM n=1 Tax=Parazoarcus communis SWub3 = DSM 12120 TaxID=1121029 RepID=A0A323V7N2_9RHOO|nr:type II secretion system protein GspM [Parazoarcus communis]NMG70947.1 hypothetical protein [Parazoarcus communis SWub3 = DSM 12120]PZA16168.1 hypothetical protein DNK49_12685 [Azoarcus communis] [Parazoarcus communis SWub3 = DSM 12120]
MSPLAQHRASLSVGVVVLMVVAVLGVAVAYLANKALWAEDTFETLTPRIARLEGMREAAGAVRQARLDADAALGRLAYPGNATADRIGTDLQQRIRAAAEAAGVSVSGSQIIGPRTDAGLEYIPVAFSFEATHAQLSAMLTAVAAQSPVVHVDSLILQPQRTRVGQGARLNVQVRFTALRVAS